MANQHRTVWKYTIPVQDDPVRLELPATPAGTGCPVPRTTNVRILVWVLVATAVRKESTRRSSTSLPVTAPNTAAPRTGGRLLRDDAQQTLIQYRQTSGRA